MWRCRRYIDDQSDIRHGTVSLGTVQTDGTQQVIYTASAFVPASTPDAVGYTVTENGATVAGVASVPLDAGPSITSEASFAVGQGQTTNIGTVTAGLAGDTLTLKETAGAGTLNLGLMQANGTQQVIYTAPASIPTSMTDTVAYTITDQHNDAIAFGGPETVRLVAATSPPMIAAPTAATVGVGQTGPIGGISIAETQTITGETFTAVLTDTSGVLSATTSAVGRRRHHHAVERRHDADHQRHPGAAERRPDDADRQ